VGSESEGKSKSKGKGKGKGKGFDAKFAKLAKFRDVGRVAA
jgi:hypothetical protein